MQNQQGIQREYYNRTQSERILDRHMNNKGDRQKLQQLDNEIYGDARKKVKTEDQTSKELLPQHALTQVLKFISVEQKAFKAVNKIKTLLVEYTGSFHPEHILQTLWILTQCSVQFKKEQIRKDCLELYVSLSEKSNVIFSLGMLPIFEMFSFELETHNKLFTDDSFQLNDQIRNLLKLTNRIREIQDNKGDNFAHPGKFEVARVPANDYDFEYSDDMKEIITSWEKRNDVRKEFLLSTVSDLITLYKQPWAKASVNQYMNNLYHNNIDIFTLAQQERLTNYMREMQGIKTQFTNNSSKADVEAAKMMKDYLNPIHEVVDGRSTAIVTDNLNAWAQKQCGL